MEKENPKNGQPVNAVEQAPAQRSVASSTQVIRPPRISMVGIDDWMFTKETLTITQYKWSRLNECGGTAVSECPLGYVFEVPIANDSRNATLTIASGAQIEHAGQKMLEYEHGEEAR